MALGTLKEGGGYAFLALSSDGPPCYTSIVCDGNRCLALITAVHLSFIQIGP